MSIYWCSRHFRTGWKSAETSFPSVIWAMTLRSPNRLSYRLRELRHSNNSCISICFTGKFVAILPIYFQILLFMKLDK
jgi:hypothetical protein